MFRLTREVRFAVNTTADDQLAAGKPSNSYGGYPTLTGAGQYFTLAVTLAGELEARSNYLLNIKEVDAVVRARGIPLVERAVRDGSFGTGAGVLGDLLGVLRDAWPHATLESLRLSLTPFLSLTAVVTESPMVRLSQKFEFSASHRLHNPALSDEENRRTYGKCNNPHGHGHNYELQVTLAGKPDAGGVIVDIPAFERTVAQAVIDRFDHKNLNTELSEFQNLIPSVENIAKVIYTLLKPHFTTAKLHSVTVWETPKTWCEYSEELNH